MSLAYAATTHDNIVGTAAPTGQINAVIGGAPQSVGVTFTTDDHNLATALAVTIDLAALPSGWSATRSSFACASVSTGNGCQLHPLCANRGGCRNTDAGTTAFARDLPAHPRPVASILRYLGDCAQ